MRNPWPTPSLLSRARATLGAWRARRAAQHGQIMIVCAVALPLLIGIVGVTLDGGYYLATRRAAQNAADAAARAATSDILYAQTGNGTSYYASAGSDGQAVGLQNLTQFPVSGVSISMSYSSSRYISRDCTLTGSTWYTTTPGSKTRCVKAVVTGSYSTVFLSVVGIRTISLTPASGQIAAIASTRGGILPMAVCASDVAASPNGPWTIFQSAGGLCGVSAWQGLVDVKNNAKGCTRYDNYVYPDPPDAPGLATGSTAVLETRRSCSEVMIYMQWYSDPSAAVLVVDTTNGRTVLGCYDITFNVGNTTVTATPTGPLGSCQIQQVY